MPPLRYPGSAPEMRQLRPRLTDASVACRAAKIFTFLDASLMMVEKFKASFLSDGKAINSLSIALMECDGRGLIKYARVWWSRLWIRCHFYNVNTAT